MTFVTALSNDSFSMVLNPYINDFLSGGKTTGRTDRERGKLLAA